MSVFARPILSIHSSFCPWQVRSLCKRWESGLWLLWENWPALLTGHKQTIWPLILQKVRKYYFQIKGKRKKFSTLTEIAELKRCKLSKSLASLLPMAFQYHRVFTVSQHHAPKHSMPCVFSAPMGYAIVHYKPYTRSGVNRKDNNSKYCPGFWSGAGVICYCCRRSQSRQRY